MEEKNEICSFQNSQTALLCHMEIVHHVKGTLEKENNCSHSQCIFWYFPVN